MNGGVIVDIFKKHYEKFVLGFLLLSFVVALIYLLQIMSSSNNPNSGNSRAAKNTLVITRKNQPYVPQSVNEKFSVTKEIKLWQEREGEGLIGYGRPGLAVPMKSLRCSQCKKIQPWSQLRKKGLRCLFEACSQDLRDPGDPEDYEKQLANFDGDGDGLPDRYEIRLGLNPNSADDADLDKDGDKFSNWFEYFCNTNPNDPDNFPTLDKMIFLSKIELVKLPIRLTTISAADAKQKSTYKIYMTVENRDSIMNVGSMFNMLGKRYKIVDAVKRNTTEQGTSSSRKEDDSTVWVMPVKAQDSSSRIEIRSRKDVFDPKSRMIDIRDVRSPTKRRRSMINLIAGSKFVMKSNQPGGGSVAFTVKKINDKAAELEYTLDNKVKTLTLDLIDSKSTLFERIKKAYVREDANKTDQRETENRGRTSRRSSRRR